MKSMPYKKLSMMKMIWNTISSDINAYLLPKTYDAYFDMFLSQYNTTGLIDNMQ